MKKHDTRVKLNDPPVTTWEVGFRGDVHAVVLIGDASDAAQSARRTDVEALLPDSAHVLADETGLGQTNAHHDGIDTSATSTAEVNRCF